MTEPKGPQYRIARPHSKPTTTPSASSSSRGARPGPRRTSSTWRRTGSTTVSSSTASDRRRPDGRSGPAPGRGRHGARAGRGVVLHPGHDVPDSSNGPDHCPGRSVDREQEARPHLPRAPQPRRQQHRLERMYETRNNSCRYRIDAKGFRPAWSSLAGVLCLSAPLRLKAALTTLYSSGGSAFWPTTSVSRSMSRSTRSCQPPMSRDQMVRAVAYAPAVLPPM